MDELIVLESSHHEESEVDPTGDVALEHRVSDVAAPHGKTLALALLEVAAAHDGPARFAGKDPVARLHLVVEIGEASKTREWTPDLHERLELQRIHVLAVERDVPAAGEDEARPPRRIVEHRLCGARRIPVHAPRHQHGKHPIAPVDRALD